MVSLRGLRSNHGFTLVEIMVVVGVMVILMVLSLPSMLRSRMNANEASAIAVCRRTSTACQSYYSGSFPHNYPTSFQDLVNETPPYLDLTFNALQPEKSGYIFTYTREDEDNFNVIAEPRSEGRTGFRYFYVDETGIVTNKAGEQAGPNDDPVGG